MVVIQTRDASPICVQTEIRCWFATRAALLIETLLLAPGLSVGGIGEVIEFQLYDVLERIQTRTSAHVVNWSTMSVGWRVSSKLTVARKMASNPLPGLIMSSFLVCWIAYISLPTSNSMYETSTSSVLHVRQSSSRSWLGGMMSNFGHSFDLLHFGLHYDDTMVGWYRVCNSPVLSHSAGLLILFAFFSLGRQSQI